MKLISFSNEYFNPQQVLECGQIFRFQKYKNGFIVFSKDKAVYLYNDSINTYIECEATDEEYFKHYFDLSTNYKDIVDKAKSYNIPFLSKATENGKGIRILNQDIFEMIISFIVSQNNNIPRIKGIIEKMCANLGEKHTFDSKEYFSFPAVEKLANQSIDFYQSIGAGYRAEYILLTAQKLKQNGVEYLRNLSSRELKKELLSFKGIGEKVANCILLFGFHRMDSFPVDTWIEKVYKEDFNGKLTDRNKITEYFVDMFGDYSGYIQQYLFNNIRNVK